MNAFDLSPSDSVLALFETYVEKSPDAPAVEFATELLTYQELNSWASALAGQLSEAGAGPGKAIAIAAWPSLEMVAATIGVLKTGAAYVPLDPGYPRERLTYLVSDSGAERVLAPEYLADDLGYLPVPVLAMPDRGTTAEQPTPPAAQTRTSPGLADPAYIVYTSGTTGQPKGVEVAHVSLANTLSVIREHSDYQPTDVALLKYAFNFDSSVIEMFAPLTSGARLVIAAEDERKDPVRLVDLIRQHSVTVIDSVPLLLDQILEVPGVGQACGSLRLVVSGGDVLGPEVVSRFFQTLPTAELRNHYGPTETTNDSTIWRCDRDNPEETVPIGFPVRNTFVYLLDEQRRPVPTGTVGEIYIGGAGIARGYRNQPELTAERFLPDPFTAASPRMYRTGDLGVCREDGALLFQGRADRQLSMRGFRVEPEEIEAALVNHPTVRRAAVTADASSATQRLVAYVAPASPEDLPSGATLRAHLESVLPSHMVPTHYVVLGDLPLNANGKIDHAALPAPGDERPELGVPMIPPSTPDQRRLADIWQSVLNVSPIGLRDNFFALGGHSVLAIAAVSQIRTELGVDLPLSAIFQNPTVEAVAESVERERSGGGDQENTAELHRTLRRDAEVNLPKVSPTEADLARVTSPGHVLITGATDFLGAHLLGELLRAADARITCLVHGEEKRARTRLRAALHVHGVEPTGLDDVTVLAADLRLPALGLPETTFAELAESVDAVFHTGCVENLARPYSALRAANVSATSEVIRLATMGAVKAVHYSSTVSVMPWKSARPGQPGGSGRTWPERPVPTPDGLTYGFAQSKWVAEQLIHSAQRAGIPATVMRLGRIVGSTVSGRWPREDLARRLLIGAAAAGALPQREVAEPWISVEYATAAVRAIAARPDSFGEVFHVTDGTMVDSHLLARWLRESGFTTRVLPIGEWSEEVAKNPENPAYSLLGVLAEAEQESSGTGGADANPFGDAHTRAAFADRPGPWAITGDLVLRLLTDATASGEIAQPPTAPAQGA
ncbi:amino acid adenylation domain-containing protein [Streptomyces sp. N2-109]|uniref:Amino acid adenylation domain-containing protein n=1 Tax=Streptomyces gossypii TaxID=2883101 RepID=A0ABT2JP50_9ACTN|nr:amino acid adenylation domain-containing protein [Streptomyces gossypii]MCT2589641.1 amino acid adenylation domain-containing protein [Streptomyces gossypii]